MSLAEDELKEPSQENEQKESEICLKENSLTNEFDPKEPKDKDTKSKDLLQVNQQQRRTVSPLTLFKEDINHFKEELLNVFKDKDQPSSQAGNKTAASMLDLLKEDLSQFKEDVTSVFNKDKDMTSADPKTSQSINPLSFLKEDFSHFRDDISSVFRIGLLKERDNKGVTAKDEDSNTVKIKDSKAERSDEPFRNLFRRDQSRVFKTFQRAENIQEHKKTVSVKSEQQMDGGFRGNLSEQNAETVDAKKTNINKRDRLNQLEESRLDVNVSEEKTESFSDTQQSEEISTTEARCVIEERSDDSSQVSEEDEKMDKEKEEDKSSLSGIHLFCLRDTKKDNWSDHPGGDLWLLKNFACYLTFDPNTANSELHLTDCNRKATRVWSDHRPPDHPDRFERCPQLLCREGLLDSVYWEVVWSGGADIGVTYNSICRDGDAASCLLGYNDRSWSLECSEGSYTPNHNNRRLGSCSPEPFTHRVGVYLDWSAGSLSFYCVSQDAMVHLHTFTSTFTEPLYPGFWVWAYDGSVSLRQVELDWERLLQ